MKSVMTANIVIKSMLVVCVTVAACFFAEPKILWWYTLLPLVGYEYKTERGDSDGKE